MRRIDGQQQTAEDADGRTDQQRSDPIQHDARQCAHDTLPDARDQILLTEYAKEDGEIHREHGVGAKARRDVAVSLRQVPPHCGELEFVDPGELVLPGEHPGESEHEANHEDHRPGMPCQRGARHGDPAAVVARARGHHCREARVGIPLHHVAPVPAVHWLDRLELIQWRSAMPRNWEYVPSYTKPSSASFSVSCLYVY